MRDNGRRTGRPTLEEVAARAGVGRGTVSRVVNGSPLVSPETKAVVERAISDLGYVPNRAARALAGNRNDAIALVIPEADSRLFAEPYFSDIIRGVDAALADTDTQLLLTLSRTPRERKRLTQFFGAHRVDGVLMVSVHEDDPLPDLLEHLQMPAVLAGRRSGREAVSYVDSDNSGGARDATAHLLAQGRRAVATITGPLDMYVARCRLDGYRTALRETIGDAAAKAAERLCVAGDFTEEGGLRATREILQRCPEVDAIFAASDVMAAGALRALRQAGRRVPDDVALVGFDDSVIARHTDPLLTSVRQPVQEMGRTMARVLLEQISDPSATRRHVILDTELVRRESA
ncbi:LacI family DNA-binding transcriptional regulator [Streptomyces sp. ICBB 8177]|uniref:LacI family DNA-binding transcriptional regulator n=1 Tax=Streptomyces sp. ICBB 8177 TaxID=563922 RepID=UPI000D6827F3|nr:LacI family DNA-binding transcriptional regulator [Streptomyces sp. ICBB 8177]PWI44956.1 LacI family transcriptional regulator [Streptomyces sp. ICBB 8177]